MINPQINFLLYENKKIISLTISYGEKNEKSKVAGRLAFDADYYEIFEELCMNLKEGKERYKELAHLLQQMEDYIVDENYDCEICLKNIQEEGHAEDCLGEAISLNVNMLHLLLNRLNSQITTNSLGG